MATIGYARVSKEEQNLDAQIDALRQRCDKVFSEKVSSRKDARAELQKCLDYLRSGDVLVVTKLDRLARGLKELIRLVEDLKERGIGFCSIDDRIETETPQGKFFFHVFGAVAEFERDLIRERTKAALDAARARGRVGGRPNKMTRDKIETISRLLKSGADPAIVAEQVGIAKSTLYRYFPRGKASNKIPL
jgi:DNA invertase Pin-like site-specific DNA recombinase